jgi:DNA-binding NarL/FixJ family response regulator
LRVTDYFDSGATEISEHNLIPRTIANAVPRQPLLNEDSGKKPTLVVVDDHLAIVEEIVRLLRNQCQILGTANSGLHGIEAVVMTDPDVTILDICMPDLVGFEVAKRIRALQSRTKFVFITAMEDRVYAEASIDMGSAFVLKRRMHSDLLPAIEHMLAGRLFISPFETK